MAGRHTADAELFRELAFRGQTLVPPVHPRAYLRLKGVLELKVEWIGSFALQWHGTFARCPKCGGLDRHTGIDH